LLVAFVEEVSGRAKASRIPQGYMILLSGKSRIFEAKVSHSTMITIKVSVGASVVTSIFEKTYVTLKVNDLVQKANESAPSLKQMQDFNYTPLVAPFL
jgi:hypothetical protein